MGNPQKSADEKDTAAIPSVDVTAPSASLVTATAGACAPEATEAEGAPSPTVSDPEATAGVASDDQTAIDSDALIFELHADIGRETELWNPGAGEVASQFDHINIPNYRILGELGRGGMGVVYKAEHNMLSRIVALKVILAGSHAGPEQVARFLTEARAVATLQHPDIIQIFDIGETNGLPYFSLEYVDGGSLDARLAGRPQDPAWAAGIAEALARAMHVAHARGIVHRDLKPANVLMTSAGRPKITDFGLARRLETDSGQTRSGSILGTPSFMAPEQAHGLTHEAGPAADLYSLGAILYVMITGRPPHQGTTMLETLDFVRNREPLPPSQLQPKVPRDLETICLKCLQKEPSRRYADAGALADDLRRFQEGAPILARPVAAPERVLRWARRHPRDAALIAVVSLLIVTVIATQAIWARALGEKNARLNTSLANESEAKRVADERRTAAERAERIARDAQGLAESRKEAAEAARKVAEQKTQEARANLAKALEQNMETINAWRSFGKTSYEDLPGIPGTEQVRLRLLEVVRLGLEESIRQMKPLYEAARVDEKNTRTIDQAMAGVYKQVAETLVSIGRVTDARKPFAEMDRIYEALAREYGPGDDHYLWTLAIGKGALGTYQLYSLGDTEAADRNFKESLRIHRDRLGKDPQDGGKIRNVANALGAVAAVALRAGRADVARTYYDEEVRVRESIPEPLRSMYEVRRELSGLHEKLGQLCLSQGDRDRSREHFQRSFEIRELLADAEPDNVPNLRDIYRSYENFGHIALLQLQDPAGARTYYRNAVEGFSALVERDQASAIFRGDLATAHYYLATALLRLGEKEASMKSYRVCRDLRRKLAGDSNARLAQIDLMLALARCGEHLEGAEIAHRAIKSPPQNAELYIEVACGLALCAGSAEKFEQTLARTYADEAVAAIRRGQALGWRDDERLKVDPDLDPVRSNPGFQQLLAELKAPSAKAKQ
jgi:serine/threonine-protein kinase